jgi:hypothetical protein
MFGRVELVANAGDGLAQQVSAKDVTADSVNWSRPRSVSGSPWMYAVARTP